MKQTWAEKKISGWRSRFNAGISVLKSETIGMMRQERKVVYLKDCRLRRVSSDAAKRCRPIALKSRRQRVKTFRVRKMWASARTHKGGKTHVCTSPNCGAEPAPAELCHCHSRFSKCLMFTVPGQTNDMIPPPTFTQGDTAGELLGRMTSQHWDEAVTLHGAVIDLISECERF